MPTKGGSAPPRSPWPLDLAHIQPFRIGSVDVRPASREVVAGERREVLEPLVMQVLIALARARGEILSRDDLIAACWEGRAVSDDAVNRVLSRLRALARTFEGFEVETINKVGYRLVAQGGEEGFAPSEQDPNRRRLMIAAVSIAVLAVIALIAWGLRDRSSSVPIVAVAATDRSPASHALAGDLFVKLGSLQSARPESIDLVSQGATTGQPMLTFRVGRSSPDQQGEASLALLDSKNGSLLWSKVFRDEQGNGADLRQQLAYSAAQVLNCAAETMKAQGVKLGATTRKLYLNACAAFAESLGGDISAVVPMFEQVTRSAPQFRSGWKMLLLSETQFAAGYGSFKLSTPEETIRRHISQARRRFPDLAEIALAENSLLPRSAYGQRMALADRAIRLGPADPFVLVIRAFELLMVGRSNEAVVSAQRAVELDPTSPAIRHSFINTLTYSGRLDWARDAIADSERLWPGASSIRDAKIRFHGRYGDPAVASAILRERGTDPVMEAFLRARIHRTPENVEQAVQDARLALSRNQDIVNFVQVLGEFGKEEELYSALANWKGELAESYDVLFRPKLKKFRQSPRFLRIAKRAGWLDYWQSSGNWPDFCFERDLPYDCKKEAKSFS